MSDKTYTEDELKAKIDDEVKGLKAKNEELITKLKKRDEDYKGLEGRLGELETAQEEADRLKAEKDGDVQKAVAAAEKKWNKEREALINERDGAKDMVQKHLVENGLNNALLKAGVAPETLEYVAAGFHRKHGNTFEVSEEGVKIDGKPLEDFVSEWSQGATAKPFIAADRNGGGGAQGAGGGGQAPAGKKASEMSQADKSAFIAEHGIDAWTTKVRSEDKK